MDVPQDIRGIDVGPSPTPYERAEQLAAEAYGARVLVVPHERRDAGQPRTVPRARAARGARRRAAQLARLGRRRARPERRRADLRRARVRPRARHGARRHAGVARGGARARPRARAQRSSSRRRTTACRPTSPAAPRSRTRAGVPLVVDQSWGAHFGFHPALPAERAGARRRRGAHEHAQARRLAHAERDPAPRPRRPHRRDPCLPRRTDRAVDQPVVTAARVARRARRQLAVHGEQLLHETLQAIGGARDRLREVDGVELLDQELVGRPGIAAYDPLRIVLDTRGTGCTGMELADVLRQSYDLHAELATQSTIVFVVGVGERPESLLRARGRRRGGGPPDQPPRERDGADLPAGRVARARRLTARRVPRRLRGRPRRRRRRADLVRVDRGLPAGDPGAAARRADHGRDRPLPARDRRRGRAPPRRARPGVRAVFVLVEPGRSASGHPRPARRLADGPAVGEPVEQPRPSASGARSPTTGRSRPSAHQVISSSCAAAANSWSTGSMPP